MTASAPSYILGIDVSKDHLDLALLRPDPPERPVATTRVSNTASGMDALAAWVAGQTDRPVKAAFEHLHACLEASGGYEQAATRDLHNRGAVVSVVNPRRTAAYGQSLLRRSKTDGADARLLARFAHREQPDLWQPPDPNQEDLKQMSRGLEQLKREQSRLKTQRDRADHDAVTTALDAVLERIAEQIDRLQTQIDAHVRQCQLLRRRQTLLQSIPGVGKATAIRLLAELGDPARFDSARQVAAFAGLTPSHHTSGTSVARRSRLSKIGSGRLRNALYFPAMTALRHNGAVKALGERLAERGKAKMVIVGAAMRKLLHICYGVLKNDEPFNAALHPGT